MPDLHLFDQRLYEELTLALVEAREVGDEVLELIRDRLRVIGLFLQLIDLVLDGPLLLLKPDLFLGDPVYLGVDEVDGLGCRLVAEQPAGELLPLRAESGEVMKDRLALLLQLREGLPVVLHVLINQGRDDILAVRELGDLPDDAFLQNVRPDVVL